MQPDEAHERRDEIQLIDVREPHEWAAGHIDAAVHVPMRELAARQDELSQDRLIVPVCRSGARSAQVTKALRQAGYDAENLDGGMHAWAAAGLPFSSEDGEEPHVA